MAIEWRVDVLFNKRLVQTRRGASHAFVLDEDGISTNVARCGVSIRSFAMSEQPYDHRCKRCVVGQEKVNRTYLERED